MQQSKSYSSISLQNKLLLLRYICLSDDHVVNKSAHTASASTSAVFRKTRNFDVEIGLYD